MSLQNGGSMSSTAPLALDRIGQLKAQAQAAAVQLTNGSSSSASSMSSSASLAAVLNEAYEEEIASDPFRPKIWISYVETIPRTNPGMRYLMYERAVKAIPRSYKLWKRYLDERRLDVSEREKREAASVGIDLQQLASDKEEVDAFLPEQVYTELNSVYDRALVFLHKMPRIWIDYIEFLVHQKQITSTRRAIDGAIRTLPIHQQYRIWNVAIPWVIKTSSLSQTVGAANQPSGTGSGTAANKLTTNKNSYLPRSTCLNLFRRYLMLEPGHVETFIQYLIGEEIYDEAAVRMVEILNDEEFVSINNKSRHQLWLDLCELISKNPREVHSIKIEPIIRQGISKFTDEVGRLWICLADHFIRLAWFDKARAIYQEAIETITTAHDFALVYESYEVFLTDWLEIVDEKDPVGEELQFAILEDLMDKRPLLLNSVLLRQNPNVVAEWLKRVEIYRERNDLEMVVQTYKEAVATVDPKKSIGKIQDLWIAFGRFFEQQDDGDLSQSVRPLFQEAVKVHFAHADDLASIWTEWIEMELRHDNFQEALDLARQSITLPPTPKTDKTDEHGNPIDEPQNVARIKSVRSKKLWYLTLDLEENFGTFETCRATYERMIDLKIATPQVVINYAHYLEERKYFEQSFKVYEKGVTLFRQPHSYDLWLFYLVKFMQRYKAKKLERARDLFDEAIKGCSNSEAMQMRLHVLYGKLEERYGLAKKALMIYQKACEVVKNEPESQLKMWTLLLVRTGEIKGGDVARNVLKAAIDTLPEGDGLIHFGLLFSELENSFGELARARVIYEHISQYCDPRKYAKFWEIWQRFEMRHGNADTFKEMRRIQRSVEAAYAQVHFNAPDITTQLDELKDKVALDPMAQAEKAMRDIEEAKQKDPNSSAAVVVNNKNVSKDVAAFLQKRNRLLEELGVNQRERDSYFEPCESYMGTKLGYVFKTGIKGLGYYEDSVGERKKAAGVIAKKAVAYEGAALSNKRPAGAEGGEEQDAKETSKKESKKPRLLGDEEIDLADLDDEDEEVLETNAVPDFLDDAAKQRLQKMKEEEMEAARELRAKQESETLLPTEEQEEAEKLVKKKKANKPVGGALARFQKKKAG